MAYRILDHTADVGIELAAADRDELFAEAAAAFTDTVTDIRTVEPAAEHRVALPVEAGPLDELLVAWLQELLYLHETTGFLAARAEVVIEDQPTGVRRLTAILHGEPFDPARHPHRVLVKAITYHRLEVAEEPDGSWRGRVIFDI